MSDVLTEEELSTLISLAGRVLYATPEFKKKLQEHDINIVPANFYSQIPSVDEINNSFEYKDDGNEIYNSEIFKRKNIQDFMEQIGVYAEEFSPPMEGSLDDPKGYFWKNPAFSFFDAMSYYCVLRHYKPLHVLEVGSGFSTLVADAAIKKNNKGRLTLIEPYPMAFLSKLDSVDTIIESFVQDIPVPELVTLVESADIWFIDSTHTVKVGSDCLYLYLKIMPEISKDIIVHTHDIYLPFGSNKKMVLEKQIFWTEQYLLYAYMLDNPKIEVLFGGVYVNRVLPEVAEKFMAGKSDAKGASLWYKLNGA